MKTEIENINSVECEGVNLHTDLCADILRALYYKAEQLSSELDMDTNKVLFLLTSLYAGLNENN